MNISSPALTESKQIVLAYLRIWRDLGCDTDLLLSELGLSVNTIANENNRVEVGTVIKLFDIAGKHLADPLLGIKTAMGITPRDFGILGLLVVNSQNHLAALSICEKFHSLVGDVGSASAEINQSHLTLSFSNPYVPISSFQFDYFMAISVRIMYWLNERDPAISSVVLDDSRKHLKSHFRQFFRAPVKFSRHSSYIVLPVAQLSKPNPNFDPSRFARLETIADRYLNRQKTNYSMSDKVLQRICVLLSDSEVSRERVAKSLNCSVRTMQRHLEKEGTSFKMLYDEVRKDIALSYIHSNSYSAQQLGEFVGFNETSAFYKAFRRWTGTVPGYYREQKKPIPLTTMVR